MNLCTWVGIIIGAILYGVCIWALGEINWPPSTIFAMTALLMVPVAIFYRPRDVRLAEEPPL